MGRLICRLPGWRFRFKQTSCGLSPDSGVSHAVSCSTECY